MYMNPKLRRVLLFLDRITARVALLHQPLNAVTVGTITGPAPLQRLPAEKKMIHLERNTGEFTLFGKGQVSVPLTQIEDIWMDSGGEWNIRVAGRFQGPERGDPIY